MGTTSDHQEQVLEQWHALRFAARRSRRYHMRRERYFAKFHFLFGFLTTVAGSATFATILADLAVGAWLAGLTAFFGAIELVGQPYSRAIKHRELTQAFTRLEQEMHLPETDVTEARLHDLERKRLEIEVQEPPVLQVLNLICHNEEVLAGGYGSEHFRKIRWYQRVIASLFDLRLSTFQQPSAGR